MGNDSNRLINETTIDDMKIITRFTGRNIFAFTSDRLLFETTIEGGLFDGYSDYSSTYEEALKTHEEVCAKVTFYKP
jgi:hypothetical protein